MSGTSEERRRAKEAYEAALAKARQAAISDTSNLRPSNYLQTDGSPKRQPQPQGLSQRDKIFEERRRQFLQKQGLTHNDPHPNNLQKLEPFDSDYHSRVPKFPPRINLSEFGRYNEYDQQNLKKGQLYGVDHLVPDSYSQPTSLPQRYQENGVPENAPLHPDYLVNDSQPAAAENRNGLLSLGMRDDKVALRAKQLEYAKELQKQMHDPEIDHQRQHRDADSNSGFMIGAENDKFLKKKKQLEYAAQLNQQQTDHNNQYHAHRDYHHDIGEDIYEGGGSSMVAGNGLNGMGMKDEKDKLLKRQKQVEYSKQLALQVRNKPPLDTDHLYYPARDPHGDGGYTEGYGYGNNGPRNGGGNGGPVGGMLGGLGGLGQGGRDDDKAAKKLKQLEYAAQLRQQSKQPFEVAGHDDYRSPQRRPMPGQGEPAGGGGGILPSGADEDKSLKRRKQQEYARQLEQQAREAEAKKAKKGVRGKQNEDGEYPSRAAPAAPLEDGWVIGPLGMPVRATLNVGNRGEQKAFYANSPPKAIPAPQGGGGRGSGARNPYPEDDYSSDVGYGGRGGGYNGKDEYGYGEQYGGHDLGGGRSVYGEPSYPDQALYGDIGGGVGRGYQNEDRPGKGGGGAGAGLAQPITKITDVWEEREQKAKLLRIEQARALEEQIRQRKALKEEEDRKLKMEDDRLQQKIERDRRELMEAEEREKQLAKMKIEEEHKAQLKKQIEEKKRLKDLEERNERARDQQDEARLKRDREELGRGGDRPKVEASADSQVADDLSFQAPQRSQRDGAKKPNRNLFDPPSGAPSPNVRQPSRNTRRAENTKNNIFGDDYAEPRDNRSRPKQNGPPRGRGDDMGSSLEGGGGLDVDAESVDEDFYDSRNNRRRNNRVFEPPSPARRFGENTSEPIGASYQQPRHVQPAQQVKPNFPNANYDMNGNAAGGNLYGGGFMNQGNGMYGQQQNFQSSPAGFVGGPIGSQLQMGHPMRGQMNLGMPGVGTMNQGGIAVPQLQMPMGVPAQQQSYHMGGTDPVIQQLQQIAIDAKREAVEARKELQQLKYMVGNQKSSSGTETPGKSSRRPQSDSKSNHRRNLDASSVTESTQSLDKTLTSESRFIYPDGTAVQQSRSHSAGSGLKTSSIFAAPKGQVGLPQQGYVVGKSSSTAALGKYNRGNAFSPTKENNLFPNDSRQEDQGRDPAALVEVGVNTWRSETSTPGSMFDVDELMLENKRKWKLLEQIEHDMKDALDDEGTNKESSKDKFLIGVGQGVDSGRSVRTGYSSYSSASSRPDSSLASPMPTSKNGPKDSRLQESFSSIPLVGQSVAVSPTGNYRDGKPVYQSKVMQALLTQNPTRSTLSKGGESVVNESGIRTGGVYNRKLGTPTRGRASPFGYSGSDRGGGSRLSSMSEEDEVDLNAYGL